MTEVNWSIQRTQIAVDSARRLVRFASRWAGRFMRTSSCRVYFIGSSRHLSRIWWLESNGNRPLTPTRQAGTGGTFTGGDDADGGKECGATTDRMGTREHLHPLLYFSSVGELV